MVCICSICFAWTCETLDQKPTQALLYQVSHRGLAFLRCCFNLAGLAIAGLAGGFAFCSDLRPGVKTFLFIRVGSVDMARRSVKKH